MPLEDFQNAMTRKLNHLNQSIRLMDTETRLVASREETQSQTPRFSKQFHMRLSMHIKRISNVVQRILIMRTTIVLMRTQTMMQISDYKLVRFMKLLYYLITLNFGIIWWIETFVDDL